jgi:dienelactone hydrolase
MEQMTFREVTDRLVALYGEGKFEEALPMIEAHLDAFPEQKARMVFWRMCLLSLSNRLEETISVFRRGLESGLWWQPELFADPDLNAVRDLPEFQRLMAVSEEKYEAGRAQIEREYAILQPEPPASGRYPLLITLHGRNGNKDADLGQWEVARKRGWLVLSCQSTQPVFQGAYHWDNPATGLSDLQFYYEQASQKYPIDPQRNVIAGFSQGSGMAIYAARRGTLPVHGFIGIGTWWAEPNVFALGKEEVRGYFVTGEKDHTLERAREIQDVLRTSGIQFSEEAHAELGHAFSDDFGSSFDQAIAFIFKEKE